MPKVVLITGVSSGFGLAIAEQLAKCNHIVYGTVRKNCDPVANVNYIQMDVTLTESVEQAVQAVYEKEGRIDVLINNAGTGISGPIEFTPLEDAKYQMDVNYFGVVRTTQAVLPIMRKQLHGLIICIGSIGGFMGLPFQGHYAASKFAIEGFCEALRLEVKSQNIRVVVVNPGDFSTKFTSNRKVIDLESVQSHYPQFQNAMKMIENDEMGGLSPQVLASKIEKIISLKNPFYRYIVASAEQKLAVYLKRILPEKVFANIIGKHYQS